MKILNYTINELLNSPKFLNSRSSIISKLIVIILYIYEFINNELMINFL